jgi:hypothetical protein
MEEKIIEFAPSVVARGSDGSLGSHKSVVSHESVRSVQVQPMKR